MAVANCFAFVFAASFHASNCGRHERLCTRKAAHADPGNVAHEPVTVAIRLTRECGCARKLPYHSKLNTAA